MRKVVFLILTVTTLLLTLGTTAAAASVIDINHDQSTKGYVSVKFDTGSVKKTKLQVAKGDGVYYYNLHTSPRYENYPLQMGSGGYNVNIYENTTGTKYKKIKGSAFDANVTDTNAVYLNSIQEISFAPEDEVVKLAVQLKADALQKKKTTTGNVNATLTDRELMELYYNYVVTNITYDYAKISTLNYDYLPDNDATLATKTGICYDFSSLLAAMLRSQGVPTKLVKGYTTWTEVYHAWNEVYIASEGRWVIVDTTYDSYLYVHNKGYTLEKSVDVYQKSKEF